MKVAKIATQVGLELVVSLLDLYLVIDVFHLVKFFSFNQRLHVHDTLRAETLIMYLVQLEYHAELPCVESDPEFFQNVIKFFQLDQTMVERH